MKQPTFSAPCSWRPAKPRETWSAYCLAMVQVYLMFWLFLPTDELSYHAFVPIAYAMALLMAGRVGYGHFMMTVFIEVLLTPWWAVSVPYSNPARFGLMLWYAAFVVTPFGATDIVCGASACLHDDKTLVISCASGVSSFTVRALRRTRRWTGEEGWLVETGDAQWYVIMFDNDSADDMWRDLLLASLVAP